ncbi:hypothetical protein [Bifidobacterium sp. ESL0745]|uniref:hypothetical protein n=1 Tax=Bifidobacterium sp. ESL0745 TaxID=2983226 RepID=UPI0023F9A9F0|nr:hypothetical protein [Bifidobacterium sp. ESL0745]MDF7665739.1 hypothetical protein [Bifidobacterium sp. ESL0745]
MTVVSRAVGRADFDFQRFSDNEAAARWRRDNFDGRGYTPVDLRAWKGTFLMRLTDGRQVYAQACDLMTSQGWAIAKIPYTAFSGQEWWARRTGSWRIDVAGPNGEHRLIGWGYWTLSE